MFIAPDQNKFPDAARYRMYCRTDIQSIKSTDNPAGGGFIIPTYMAADLQYVLLLQFVFN